MKKELYDLLLRSFDEELSAHDRQRLDRALEQSAQLREEQLAIKEMRTVLHQQHFAFQPFFVGKVMTQIETLAQADPFAPYHWTNAFRRVAIPGLVVLIAMLMFTWFSEGSINLETMMGISDIYQADIIAQYYTAEVMIP